MDKLYVYIFLVAFSKLLETYKQQDLCPIFGLAITTIVAFPVTIKLPLILQFFVTSNELAVNKLFTVASSDTINVFVVNWFPIVASCDTDNPVELSAHTNVFDISAELFISKVPFKTN